MALCELSQGSLIIQGEVIAQFIGDLYDDLKDALHQDGPMDVDMSRVEDLDLAGLQLLLSFLRTRIHENPTRLTAISAPLGKALELTGLKQQFAQYM